jgi:hypothetical protein
MTAQLLIYETVVPLSFGRHRDCSVEIAANYGFSGKVNSVPLMAVEFPEAAADYAIVFAGTQENVMPAVILGIRDKENLYLSKDSTWQAKYIPAFVRRYPFVFSMSPDEQRFVLCIDEEFSGFNREGRGQRLFGEDGKPSQYVENILKFLQEYQAQFRRTQAFCKKVQELDLLEPMQAQLELSSGERLSLGGFTAVNRAKLKAVPGDKLAALAKTDELELLYLHLQSMRNFTGLPERLAGKTSGQDREMDAAAGSTDGGTAATKENDSRPKASSSNKMKRAAPQ